ncbi:hypothetical protein, partial [Streptomyces sp. x-45]
MENIKLQDEIVMILVLVLLGLGAGALLGNGGAGAAVGALVGGLLFGASRFSAYQSRQPQAMASAAQQKEENFARAVSETAIAAAEDAGLSHEETERLVSFAYARRHGEEGITLMVHRHQGTLRGYVGPVDQSGDMERALRANRNPMPELKRMGYGAIVLRSPERESAAVSSQQAGSRAFEVGVTTQVAGPSRARGGRQAQAQVPWVAPAAARAAAPQMEFDTARLVDTQLSGRERRS